MICLKLDISFTKDGSLAYLFNVSFGSTYGLGQTWRQAISWINDDKYGDADVQRSGVTG